MESIDTLNKEMKEDILDHWKTAKLHRLPS